jgi:secretion/DNA translocation related TadE-like protein
MVIGRGPARSGTAARSKVAARSNVAARSSVTEMTGTALKRWDLASDAGSGTVLGLALLTLVLFGAAVGMARVQQVIAIRQASLTADLAALAGAQAVADRCGRAGAVAAANGARLSHCSVAGTDVVVQVARPMPPFTAGLLESFGLPTSPVTAEARAGYPESS